MNNIKKVTVATALFATILTASSATGFASEPTIKTNASTASSPVSVVQKPTATTSSTAPITIKNQNGTVNPSLSDTTTGNGGTATITLMDSDRSFAWSLKPSWYGPYEYTVYVRITNRSGNYVTQQKFGPGLALGTKTGVTQSFLWLPSGDYWATLIGSCIFDPGTAEIGEPTIPFYIK